jgi:hypothetical protein
MHYDTTTTLYMQRFDYGIYKLHEQWVYIYHVRFYCMHIVHLNVSWA